MAYNKAHGITPTQIKKNISNALAQEKQQPATRPLYSNSDAPTAIACDPIVQYMNRE